MVAVVYTLGCTRNGSFAELDENNIVQRVLVIGNEMICDENGEEDETLGDAYLRDLLPGSGLVANFL